MTASTAFPSANFPPGRHEGGAAKIAKEVDRLIQAICDGVPGSQVKDRMANLEVRRTEIEAKL